MNRKYPMILVMKSMLQFVAVMDKLIQMIAMLKMQVSQNGLKASVNKKPELHQAPPSSGFFVYRHLGLAVRTFTLLE